MRVEKDGLDPGIREQRLGPRQQDRIVAPQQLFHTILCPFWAA